MRTFLLIIFILTITINIKAQSLLNSSVFENKKKVIIIKKETFIKEDGTTSVISDTVNTKPAGDKTLQYLSNVTSTLGKFSLTPSINLSGDFKLNSQNVFSVKAFVGVSGEDTSFKSNTQNLLFKNKSNIFVNLDYLFGFCEFNDKTDPSIKQNRFGINISAFYTTKDITKYNVDSKTRDKNTIDVGNLKILGEWQVVTNNLSLFAGLNIIKIVNSVEDFNKIYGTDKGVDFINFDFGFESRLNINSDSDDKFKSVVLNATFTVLGNKFKDLYDTKTSIVPSITVGLTGDILK